MITDIPQFLRDHYEIHEWRHASSILIADFRQQWADIVAILTAFRLLRSDITRPGGRKSPIAQKLEA